MNKKIDVTIKKRNCFLEVPWGFQNPLKIDPGTSLRDPKACKGSGTHALVASWVHAGIIPGELWELLGVTKVAQGRPGTPKWSPGAVPERPGAAKLDQN